MYEPKSVGIATSNPHLAIYWLSEELPEQNSMKYVEPAVGLDVQRRSVLSSPSMMSAVGARAGHAGGSRGPPTPEPRVHLHLPLDFRWPLPEDLPLPLPGSLLLPLPEGSYLDAWRHSNSRC